MNPRAIMTAVGAMGQALGGNQDAVASEAMTQVPFLDIAMAHPDVRTKMAVHQATSERNEMLDDYGAQQAAKDLERAAKRMQDAQGALDAQRQVAPPAMPTLPGAPTMNTSEIGAALFAGLMGEDFGRAIDTGTKMAAQRQQVEYGNQMQAYQTEQGQQKMTLDTLLQELEAASRGEQMATQNMYDAAAQQTEFAQRQILQEGQQEGRSQLEEQKAQQRASLQTLVNQGKLDANNVAKQFEETKASMAAQGFSMPDEELWNIVAADQITKLQNAESRQQEAETSRLRALTAQESVAIRNKHFYDGWRFRKEERIAKDEAARERTEISAAAAMERLLTGNDMASKKQDLASIGDMLKTLQAEKRQAEQKAVAYRGALTKNTKPEQAAVLQNSIAELQRYVTEKLDPEIHELRKVYEAAKSPFGLAPARGQTSSRSGGSARGSSKKHEAEAAEIKRLFENKVEVWSEPRPMRSGGGTGMSRHGEGRAVDAHYKTLGQRDQLINHAKSRNATLIIDYLGKRTWRPGRGWKASPKLDAGLRHIHIEFD